jgi:hypothetical protein
MKMEILLKSVAIIRVPPTTAVVDEWMAAMGEDSYQRVNG